MTRRWLADRVTAVDPFRLFQAWYALERRGRAPWSSVATMATVGRDGRPSARCMSLRSVDENGFVFYTDYDSRKGLDLAGDARVALVFAWADRLRQVRIEGEARPVSAEESDHQFAHEPRQVQERIITLPQSTVVHDHDVLKLHLSQARARYRSRVIDRPPTWGGYRVHPFAIEFWQERPDYLHDRVRYERTAGAWTCTRLAP